MNFWQGKLVRLRGVEPSDAEAFARWNLDSEAAREMDFIWPPISLARIAKDTEELALKKFESGDFVFIVEDGAGVAVGSINAHHCNQRAGTFEYGLFVAREHRRRGYAAEAVLLLLKHYFAELRYQKCTVSVHADNDASIALHERLGFRREGTLRRMVYAGGRYFDLHYYGLTREEWEQLAHHV
ncbi:MAG TPA: GNAT family protein [Pyrinomonadaceae bacterium]|jgi:RimJ/RimL family protein N-acetyltransferase|nr:GNAT family protein [Pyrinomonadaceae bacterium]